MSAAEKVKADYAKKLAQAEREDAIRAVLPETYRAGARIHVHELYGTVASVSFGDKYREIKITWADAVALAKALPAVSLTTVRDGCLSFQPTGYVEALPESKKTRWELETPMSPIYLDVEGFQGPNLSLHWVAQTPIGLVRVAVEMGFMWAHPGIGRYEAKRTEFRGGFKYEPATFHPASELQVVYNADGEAIGQLERPIRSTRIESRSTFAISVRTSIPRSWLRRSSSTW